MWVADEVRATCYKQKDTCDDCGNPRTIVHHIDFNHDNNDPENLIWVSQREHTILHKPGFKTGNVPWHKGTHGLLTAWNKGLETSAETKSKISKTKLNKHLHWFNNGIKSVLAESCPEGYVKGRIVK